MFAVNGYTLLMFNLKSSQRLSVHISDVTIVALCFASSSAAAAAAAGDADISCVNYNTDDNDE